MNSSLETISRQENIIDWALNEFRTHYTDDSITKWDIFHATYAILHHPEYRTRYAANLKRELPRIPFPPDFHSFAAAGKRLMELHIDYEQQPEYPLEQVEDPDADISWAVTKMKLSKDKTELRYNSFLSLRGIPAGVYDYRLGNRSALEWVIDQYQVSTDKRSSIVNDPTARTTPGTSCASSGRSSPCRWKPTPFWPPCPASACQRWVRRRRARRYTETGPARWCGPSGNARRMSTR